MMKLSSGVLAVSSVAMLAGACGSDTDVATFDDLEQARVRSYQLDGVGLPIARNDAAAMSFDLDGDRVYDNALGMAYATLAQHSEAFQILPVIESALASEVEWALTVYDDPDTGTIYAARLTRASDLGDVEPAFADLADPTKPLVGDLSRVPLGTLSDAVGGAAPGWVDARRLHIAIDSVTDTQVVGRVGVAIATADLATTLAPALAQYFTTRLAVNDSQFAADADTDDDGVVTAAEFQAHGLVQSILSPDLVIEELATRDAISLGFVFGGSRE